MKVLALLKTRPGRIFLSLLWGFALSLLFHKTCSGGRCVVVQGPPAEQVAGAVYEFGGACYRFTPRAVACDQQAAEVLCAARE